jgi:biotin carboxylase
MILVLAGGDSQYSLASALKKQGCELVVVDQNRDAPCFALADEVVLHSTWDAEGILGKLAEKKLADKIEGIAVKSSGMPVLTAASLSERLGISFITADNAHKLADKKYFLTAAAECNIPVAKLYSENKESIPFPCVVKPALSHTSKKGIHLVRASRFLSSAIEDARSYSVTGSINIEEYLEGTDFSAVYLNDTPIVLLEQISEGPPDFLSKGFVYHQANQDFSAITPLVQSLIKNFSIKNSLIQLDLKKHHGLYHIIEVHLDFGGDYIFDVLLDEVFQENVKQSGHSFLGITADALVKKKVLPPLQYNEESLRLQMIYANDLKVMSSTQKKSVVYSAAYQKDPEHSFIAGHRIYKIPAQKESAILILGGSILQQKLIEWAKYSFAKVIVSDQNPSSPGMLLADYCICRNAQDNQGILLDLQNMDEYSSLDIKGVYCGSDFGLQTVAFLQNALGLLANSEQSIKNGLSKTIQHQIFAEQGIAVPEQNVFHNYTEKIAQLDFPQVIKPADSSGSAGVEILYSSENIAEKFQTAQDLSSNDEVILEEFIEGTHHDVNLFLTADSYVPCGVLDRYFSDPPYCVPIGALAPSQLPAERQQELYETLYKAALAIGLHTGPVKADYILRGDKNYLLEITPRFHGDISSSFMLPEATEYAPPRQLFAWWNGEIYKNEAEHAYVGFRVIAGREGVFRGVANEHIIAQMPGIRHVLVRRNPGSRIQTMKDNRNLIGFLVGVGDTPEELNDNLEKALHKLEVEYE